MQNTLAIQASIMSHFLLPKLKMISECCVCKKQLKTVDSCYSGISHGYCKKCEEKEKKQSVKKIEKYLSRRGENVEN